MGGWPGMTIVRGRLTMASQNDKGNWWKRYRGWVGTVLTSAVVIPLVAWFATRAGEKATEFVSPEPYLAASVHIPSPAGSCDGGEGWVFTKDLQHLPPPPKELIRGDDADAWAAANGGIPASGNYIDVTLQGLKGHTVVVRDITVDVVSRQATPPNTTYSKVAYVGGCGGLIPYRFELNLDKHPVTITARADETAGDLPENMRNRPVDLPHAVSGSEPEVWHLAAMTRDCICEWTATLNWVSDGKEGHTVINDNGRPFRVASAKGATEFEQQEAPGGGAKDTWAICDPQCVAERLAASAEFGFLPPPHQR